MNPFLTDKADIVARSFRFLRRTRGTEFLHQLKATLRRLKRDSVVDGHIQDLLTEAHNELEKFRAAERQCVKTLVGMAFEFKRLRHGQLTNHGLPNPILTCAMQRMSIATFTVSQTTGRPWALLPIVVDLNPRTSGSKQKATPLVISESDLLAPMHSQERTEAGRKRKRRSRT